MIGAYNPKEIEAAALEMRRDVVEMCHTNKITKMHLGGSLSAVDILAVLFLAVMRYEVSVSKKGRHDRFVMSKAHSSMAHYAALAQVGLVDRDEFAQEFRGSKGSRLFLHPKRNLELGIDVSGGSLGIGIGYAAGLALALRGQGIRVFAMVGDGECNEGSVWEATAFAGKNGLSNLFVIVDCNGLQVDGAVTDILGAASDPCRWQSFGFETREIDGHNYREIYDALSRPALNGKPVAIIAHTVKGKGVSFCEDDYRWHDGFVTDELYGIAMRDLGQRQ